jgi:hypothetical protein
LRYSTMFSNWAVYLLFNNAVRTAEFKSQGM